MSKTSDLPAAQGAANVPAVMGNLALASTVADEIGLDFDASGVGPLTLARISISRETRMFGIPNDDGTKEFVKSIRGHLLLYTPARAWWSVEYGAGDAGMPECYSIGTSHIPEGDNQQSKSCLTCPHLKIGRGFDESAGLSCNEKRRTVFWREGEFLPNLLDIPALGIRAADQFIGTYNAKRQAAMMQAKAMRTPCEVPPLTLLILEVTLKERPSRRSDYVGTEPVFTIQGVETSMDKALALRDAVQVFGAMAKTEVVEKDVPNGRSPQGAPTGDDGFPGEPGADEEF